MNELRPIPNLPDYWAASDGSIWRFCKGRLQPIKSRVLKNGYLAVNTIVDGRRKTMYVHRLVYAGWHGLPPTTDSITLHKDGNSLRNHADNVRWGTRIMPTTGVGTAASSPGNVIPPRS